MGTESFCWPKIIPFEFVLNHIEIVKGLLFVVHVKLILLIIPIELIWPKFTTCWNPEFIVNVLFKLGTDEEFENLFTRVMSLVPPKELEGVMSANLIRESYKGYLDKELGRLVREGFQTWNDFDAKYQFIKEKGSNDIKNLNGDVIINVGADSNPYDIVDAFNNSFNILVIISIIHL